MEKEEFEILFDGYLKNTLSEQQLQKFQQAVNSDQYDDLIKDEIYMSLQENQPSDFIDPKQGDSILNRILSHGDNSKVIAMESAKRKRRKTMKLFFAAASITVLVGIGSVFLFKSSPIAVPAVPVEQTESNLIAFSGKQLVHLPDGSTVLLNDNSSLKYDQDSFNNKAREVTLTGEAYFDIKRNEKKAFIVHTGKVQTKVLGTAFNINAHSNKIEVTVTRGKVQVGDDQKIYGIITPNQQIKVNTSNLNYQQQDVNAAIAVEWKSKYLILDNINMEQAIGLIYQKYKVPIILSNENIKNCRITASFLNEEDLDHILKVVCSVIETEYHYNQKGSIVLEGEGCQQ